MSVRLEVGVKSIDPEHAGFYLTMVAAFLVLAGIRFAAPANLWIIIPAVLVATGVVFLSARKNLSVSDTFPELGRFALLRKILG